MENHPFEPAPERRSILSGILGRMAAWWDSLDDEASGDHGDMQWLLRPDVGADDILSRIDEHPVVPHPYGAE